MKDRAFVLNAFRGRVVWAAGVAAGGGTRICAPGVEGAGRPLFRVRSMRRPPQRMTKWELRQPHGFRGWAPGGAVALWGWTQDDYATGADTWALHPDYRSLSDG